MSLLVTYISVCTFALCAPVTYRGYNGRLYQRQIQINGALLFANLCCQQSNALYLQYRYTFMAPCSRCIRHIMAVIGELIDPAGTWLNYNVIITSKRRQRRFDVIMALSLSHVEMIMQCYYAVWQNPEVLYEVLGKTAFFSLSSWRLLWNANIDTNKVWN